MRSFDATAREFRRYHSNSFNVALHLATTPTAMACALALVEGRLGRDVARGIVWAYPVSYTHLTLPTILLV